MNDARESRGRNDARYASKETYVSTYMSLEIESRESPSIARIANSESRRCLSPIIELKAISIRKQKIRFPLCTRLRGKRIGRPPFWNLNRETRRRDRFPFLAGGVATTSSLIESGRFERPSRIREREISAIGLPKKSQACKRTSSLRPKESPR